MKRAQSDRITPAGPLLGVNVRRSRVVGADRRMAYRVWHAMHDRCLNERDSGYANYGGRGIRVCDRWSDFDLFFADMGNPPPGMWIDRIDNDGPYSPDNCRWITPTESADNRRSSKRIVLNGSEYTVREIAAMAGLTYHTISSRLKAGWAPKDLLLPKTPRTASRNAGQSNGASKLSPTDKERIRDMCRFGAPQKLVASLFNIRFDYVGALHRGVRQ